MIRTAFLKSVSYMYIYIFCAYIFRNILSSIQKTFSNKTLTRGFKTFTMCEILNTGKSLTGATESLNYKHSSKENFQQTGIILYVSINQRIGNCLLPPCGY